MKKTKPGILILLDGIVIGIIVGLIMPFEWRAKLSHVIANKISPIMEYMPDG